MTFSSFTVLKQVPLEGSGIIQFDDDGTWDEIPKELDRNLNNLSRIWNLGSGSVKIPF